MRFVQRASGVLVRGHAARLQQIMSNLIDNAIKFSPPGETITVTIDPRVERRTALAAMTVEHYIL